MMTTTTIMVVVMPITQVIVMKTDKYYNVNTRSRVEVKMYILNNSVSVKSQMNKSKVISVLCTAVILTTNDR